MAVEVELVPDTLDPDEVCYHVKYNGEHIGRVRKQGDGWEARNNAGLKKNVLFTKPDRAAMSLVLDLVVSD